MTGWGGRGEQKEGRVGEKLPFATYFFYFFNWEQTAEDFSM